jgi:hypothetical protein
MDQRVIIKRIMYVLYHYIISILFNERIMIAFIREAVTSRRRVL